MKGKIKLEKGITLIALIITIIILLILAGVTLGTLSRTGIFSKATNSKDKYVNAQEKENGLLNETMQIMENESRKSNIYTVTIVKGEGVATVTPAPGTYQYQEGETIEVTATYLEGYIAKTGTGSYTVNSNMTINVVAKVPEYVNTKTQTPTTFFRLQNGDVFIGTNNTNVLLMQGYKGVANWSTAKTNAETYASQVAPGTGLTSRLMSVADVINMDPQHAQINELNDSGASTLRADTMHGGVLTTVTDFQVVANWGENLYSWWISDSGTASHYYITGQGWITYWNAVGNDNLNYGVRPAIVLPQDAMISTGSGTSEDPYVILNY